MSDLEYRDEFIFKRTHDEYKNRMGPLNGYVSQVANLISVTNKIPMKEALDFVKSNLKNYDIKNPIVKYFERGLNGDRLQHECKLTDYLKEPLAEGDVIVPSFTTYYHPTKKRSLHAVFLEKNIALRKKDKKKAAEYKTIGDMEKATHFDTMQKTRKIFNNSLSGAYGSKSTELYNPSAHYTLTSITRCVASIGNSISEAMIAGNMLYLTPDHVFNYIATICKEIEMNKFKDVMEQFKLHYPNTKEVMESILYSSSNYWRDEEKESSIEALIDSLNKVEKAALLYVNNFYALRVYNEDVVKEMVTHLSKKVVKGSTDHLNDLYKAPEGVLNLTHLICSDEIRGKNVKYEELEGTELLDMLASTNKNICEGLVKYKRLIRAMYITDVMTIDIAHIKDMLRDAIVLSDTDSTCASYDEWVNWYFGKNVFDSRATAVSGTVMTIVTQVMDHHLKLFSRNMNIDKELVELIKMKNEYFWDVFSRTNVSKHYFANTCIVEGKVYKDNFPEVKGVHLIASTIDKEYRTKAENMIKEINKDISENGEVSINKYLTRVADIERDIVSKVKAGDINIYKTERIKDKGTYKDPDPMKTPYKHHIFWEDVFSYKYGEAGIPEYTVLKIPTILSSKRMFTEFSETIEDPVFKTKILGFLEKHNKSEWKTFRVPMLTAMGNGLPKELLNAINVDRVVFDNCNVFYLLLETLGFYRKSTEIKLIDMGY
jgi:hypothetical protein